MSDDEYVLPAFAQHFQQPAPEVLYHYTGQRGLLGIIEKQELWCTKVQYMNDATEFGLSLALARKRLDLLIISNSGATEAAAPPGSSTPPWRVVQICTGLRRSLDGLEEINIFAACFCEHGDLLSQWRGYAGGGYGYAIGFDTETLRSAAGAVEFILGKCIYDPDVQMEIVNQAIQKCIDDEVSIPSKSDWQFHGPLARTLFQYGAFFKEPSFKDEHEWRLISPAIMFRDEHLGFRPGKSMITPYYKLPLTTDGRLPIRGVIVGPCPHMELSRWSVKGLLMKNGITGPLYGQEIAYGSSIPYRDW